MFSPCTITGRSLARQTKRTESTINRVLNGREFATREFRRELSELLDVPKDALFDYSGAA